MCKALYLTCFSHFPGSLTFYHILLEPDHTHQLAHGDFILSNAYAVLLLKWSKTIQDSETTPTIPLPILGSPALCPISALNNMTKKFPAGPNDPFFALPKHPG